MNNLFSNKKGSVIDGILWVIIAFVTVIVLALLVFFWQETNNAFQAMNDTANLNITGAVDATFGVVYPAIASTLKWWSFMMIFAYALSMLLSNYLGRKVHPAMGVVIYLFMTVIAMILSVYISNTYEGMLTSSAIGPILTSFTGSTFIMLYLPIWTAVIGLIGLLFLVVGIIRDNEAGGGPL